MKITQSSRQIWLRQLKAMGRELFSLLQKYAQSMNERESHSQNRKSKNNDYVFEESKHGSRKSNRKRKQENYKDQLVQSWNADIKLVNDMFGFDGPKKKVKKHQNWRRKNYESKV